MVEIPELSTFLSAVGVAGLVDVLNSEGRFTFFPPNNDAFARIPPEILHSYLEPKNAGQLKALVSRHIVPNMTLTIFNLLDWENRKYRTLETLGGETIMVYPQDVIPENRGYKRIKSLTGKANTIADGFSCNGYFHIIDSVL